MPEPAAPRKTQSQPPTWLVFDDPNDESTQIGVRANDWYPIVRGEIVQIGFVAVYGSGGDWYEPRGLTRAFDTMEMAIHWMAGPMNRPVTIERHSEGEIRLRAAR